MLQMLLQSLHKRLALSLQKLPSRLTSTRTRLIATLLMLRMLLQSLQKRLALSLQKLPSRLTSTKTSWTAMLLMLQMLLQLLLKPRVHWQLRRLWLLRRLRMMRTTWHCTMSSMQPKRAQA
jgi:hypothetical protein